MCSMGNSSALSTTQDFHCCCFVTQEEFYTRGATGVYVFNSIVLCLTSISATLGNLLVLVAIWRTPSLHSPSNVLIFSLALSDVGVGLIVEPTFLVYNIAKIKRLVNIFCSSTVVWRTTGGLLIFASLATITLISLDLYLALHLHLRYKEIVTTKRTAVVVACVWVFSVAAAVVNFWFFDRLAFIWGCAIFVCLLVTMTSYVIVFRIVRRHQTEIHSLSQVGEEPNCQGDNQKSKIAEQRKSLISKFLIYSLLVVCYLPYVIMAAVLKNTEGTVSIESLYRVSFVLVYFNSTLNPFIYCWRFKEIRTAVIKTAKKLVGREQV